MPTPRAAQRQSVESRTWVDASPLGTAVIQNRTVPPCPPELSACVLVIDVHPECSDEAIARAFAAIGDVAACERCSATVARVRFATPPIAQHAVTLAPAFLADDERGADLGADVYVCAEYNARPYHQRGWCVFEAGLSAESCRRFGAQRAARPKMYEVTGDGGAPRVRRWDADMEATTGGMAAALEGASFTGRGDRTMVAICYESYQLRFNALEESHRRGEPTEAQAAPVAAPPRPQVHQPLGAARAMSGTV